MLPAKSRSGKPVVVDLSRTPDAAPLCSCSVAPACASRAGCDRVGEADAGMAG